MNFIKYFFSEIFRLFKLLVGIALVLAAGVFNLQIFLCGARFSGKLRTEPRSNFGPARFCTRDKARGSFFLRPFWRRRGLKHESRK